MNKEPIDTRQVFANLERSKKLMNYLKEMAQNGILISEDDAGEVRIRDTFNDVNYDGDSLEEAVDNLPNYRENHND